MSVSLCVAGRQEERLRLHSSRLVEGLPLFTDQHLRFPLVHLQVYTAVSHSSEDLSVIAERISTRQLFRVHIFGQYVRIHGVMLRNFTSRIS